MLRREDIDPGATHGRLHGLRDTGARALRGHQDLLVFHCCQAIAAAGLIENHLVFRYHRVVFGVMLRVEG
jgi:hypothetical protein